MRRSVHTYLVLVCALLPLSNVRAQLYQAWHRPIDVRYDQFETRHFHLIYQHGLADEAREMASILERRLPEAAAMVGLRRRLDAPVVLNKFTDRANGFVTALPFRQEIESVANRSKSLSPRFRGWFETVGPHELLHAVHAESGRGFGAGWLLRLFGPDLARLLNLSGPRGISEGAAVWFESRLRPGAGRLNHSLFDMEFRAAMLSDDPWNLTQMLEPPSYTRPFDRYYHGGAHLFEYLAEGDSVAFFRRARDFYYRFPLLGYGLPLWYGSGMAPSVLSKRLQQHYRKQAAAFLKGLGDLTDVQTIASGRGLVHRRPRWLTDSTLVVYAGGYHLRPGFYRANARTGAKTLIRNEALTEDFYYSLTSDRQRILYARYVQDVFEPIRSTAEAFRLDLATGDVHRLTTGGRVFAPVEGPGEHLWAVRSMSEFNGWGSVGEAGSRDGVRAFDRTTLLALVPAPHGRTVAVLANHEGRQGIFRAADYSADGISRTAGHLSVDALEAWVLFESGSIYDVSWSPDGRYLLFSADPNGVANVYAYDVEAERLYQLTNVPFGALEPSLSPDGSTVSFVNYRHERYDLARIPFEPGPANEIPASMLDRSVVAAAPAEAGTDGDRSAEADRYRPLLNLRPRVVYPFVLYKRPTGHPGDTNLGVGAGAGLEWSDPLQYWTAHTSLFYQKRSLWGRVLIRSGRFLARPSLQVFREPSTIVVRVVDQAGAVDTVRVGRDERGLGVGVRLPAVFDSNVFGTRGLGSISVEYRQERLFDDESDTIRSPDGRVTVRPLLNFNYRTQSNARDIVPNSGVVLTGSSEIDLWSEGDPSRWAQLRADLYLPFLRGSSTALQLFGHVLTQNAGGLIDLTRLFPRGYETETLFLGRGLYAKYGFEVTQPLWYIDDGFMLLPLYFRSLFVYGFVETMRSVRSSFSTPTRAVAGGGLGLQMRFAHRIDVTLRVAPVYRFASRDWNVTFR